MEAIVEGIFEDVLTFSQGLAQVYRDPAKGMFDAFVWALNENGLFEYFCDELADGNTGRPYVFFEEWRIEQFLDEAHSDHGYMVPGLVLRLPTGLRFLNTWPIFEGVFKNQGRSDAFATAA